MVSGRTFKCRLDILVALEQLYLARSVLRAKVEDAITIANFQRLHPRAGAVWSYAPVRHLVDALEEANAIATVHHIIASSDL